MRVLMFGWEFPPHIAGGLGTASYGLTRGLAKHGIEVCLLYTSDPTVIRNLTHYLSAPEWDPIIGRIKNSRPVSYTHLSSS